MKTSDGCTRYFRIMTGAKQGSVLSALIFIITIDYNLWTWDGHGIQTDNERLGNVNFADDINLLEFCKQKL